MLRSDRIATVPRSRLAILNWYTLFITPVWLVASLGLIAWGVQIGSWISWLLLSLGASVAVWAGAYLLTSPRIKIQEVGARLRFVRRVGATEIDLDAVARFALDMNGDLLSEVYLIRIISPDPRLFHIQAVLVDGTTRDFLQHCGLRRPAARLVTRLNLILAEKNAA